MSIFDWLRIAGGVFARRALFVVLATLAFATRADARVTIRFEEIAGAVVATGTGSINLAALSLGANGLYNAAVFPSASQAIVGLFSNNLITSYVFASGPSNFGPGGPTAASFGTGQGFGIDVRSLVIVPWGYVSGAPLFGSSTFNNATFASLGITPGTYTWTWGSGVTADSLTVTTIPETGITFMLGIALVSLAFLSRKKSEIKRQSKRR